MGKLVKISLFLLALRRWDLFNWGTNTCWLRQRPAVTLVVRKCFSAVAHTFVTGRWNGTVNMRNHKIIYTRRKVQTRENFLFLPHENWKIIIVEIQWEKYQKRFLILKLFQRKSKDPKVFWWLVEDFYFFFVNETLWGLRPIHPCRPPTEHRCRIINSPT